MTNIIPFENATLPVEFSSAGFELNAAAELFASVKFPVISTKNSRFHIKRDDSKTLILRPKANPSDPDEPASYIDMTILNLQRAKTFYATGYTEGSEAKPDCFSNDGVRPDVAAEGKQCETCALCPHNAWGSGKNEKGEATRGKACSDVQRLAIASPANLGDPMLLRVPPASLKNLAAASKVISGRRLPINSVVIRIAFDATANGVLTFQPIGMLDVAGMQKANAMMNDPLVLAVIGRDGSPLPVIESSAPLTSTAPAVAAAPVVDPEKEAKAKAKAEKVAKAKAAAEAAKKAAEAAAAAAAAEDDEDSEQPVQTAPAPAAVVSTSGDFDKELAALIG